MINEKNQLNTKKLLKIKIASHFLDSGAFSLRRVFLQQQKETGISEEAFYDSETFWNYIDSYIDFIRKYKAAINLYANVDVIGNPELTWRNQKYMEKHGLNLVPVVHLGTKMKYLKRYIKAGYGLIGLGGLVRNITNSGTKDWLDKCFRIVCPPPDYLPIVKVHGFGMTSVSFFYRYPWWSVDATTVEQMSRWGKILIPRRKYEDYQYQTNYYCVAMNERVLTHKLHFRRKGHMTPFEKLEVKRWLDYINESGIYNKPLKFKDEATEDLKAANFFYYTKLLQDIPDWPFEFKRPERFGLPEFKTKSLKSNAQPINPKNKSKVILYMSGGEIEETLENLGIKEVNLMLSYFPSSKGKVEKRFKRIYKTRRKGKKKWTT
jgi:hypothetical protein